MQLISYAEEHDILFKVMIALKDTDMSLVSILLDSSGGASQAATQTALEAIANVVRISSKPETRINVIHFDNSIAYTTCLTVEEFDDMVERGIRLMGLGGTTLVPALSYLAGQSWYLAGGWSKAPFTNHRKGDDIIIRGHQYVRTPIILISDGFFDDDHPNLRSRFGEKFALPLGIPTDIDKSLLFLRWEP